jgi:hypothetical protein
MRPLRAPAAVALLAVLLPTVATALRLCAMPGCSTETAAAHDCCPPPATSLAAGCCDDDRGNDPLLPARGDGATTGGAPLQAGSVAPPVVAPVLAPRAAPAAPPGARELLARHCVLRI